MVTSTSSRLNPARRPGRRVLSYVTLKDFAPGIDARSDKTAIALGMSPMARNVTWTDKGGVYCRRGVGPLTYSSGRLPVDAPPEPVVSYYNFRRGADMRSTFRSQHLIVDKTAGHLYVAADATGPTAFGLPVPAPRAGEPPLDGTWVQVSAGASPVVRYGAPDYADWDQYLYIALGHNEVGNTNPMIRWDGATATALGNAWSEDLANPTVGNMVRGRYLAALNDRLYVAYIGGASGDAKPNRIHFSHPGQPEAWRSEDWIDVGPSGDEITNIIAMRDMLVIFKRDSVWGLIGNGPENFRVVQVAEGIGSDGHVDFAPRGGVVFWDGEAGVCHFDGSKVTEMFESLRPLLRDGSITTCRDLRVAGDRVFVATDYYGFAAEPVGLGINRTWDDLQQDGLTWDGLSTSRRTWMAFVSVSRDVVWSRPLNAGWTSYTYAHPQAPQIACLGLHRNFVPLPGETPGAGQVVIGWADQASQLCFVDQYLDGLDHFDGSSEVRIDAWYLTAWLHGGLPAGVKRWKSPRVIQGASDPGPLTVGVYYDFDPYNLRRNLTVNVAEPQGRYAYEVDKPGTIGRAKAVMLRLSSTEPRQWSVQSLTIPLYPKVLR